MDFALSHALEGLKGVTKSCHTDPMTTIMTDVMNFMTSKHTT